MTGLVRKATFFAVCGLLAANVAMASTPSAANSSCPTHINLVGNHLGVVDYFDSPITIVVRDLNNLPVNNSFVVIDFSACHALQLCSDQQPGITVVCGSQQIRGFTGPDGKLLASGPAPFAIAGHANNTGSGNPSGDSDPNNGLAGSGCATIQADGTPIKSAITVGAFDENGNGVSPPDQSCFLGDEFGVNQLPFPTPRNPDRSDFDGSGTVLPSDQSLYMQVYFGTNNPINPGVDAGSDSNCPGSGAQCVIIP